MKVYFPSKADDGLSARARLLQDTLKNYFGPRADNADAPVVIEETDPGALSLLLGMRSLSQGYTPHQSLFVGLHCAPRQMTGRNTLICMRPLRDELAMFAERYPEVTTLGSGWCRDLLRNFARCIFVDHTHFRASVGFAPWVNLALAPHVPVRLPVPPLPASAEGEMEVAIFVHDPLLGARGEELVERLGRVAKPRIVTASAPPTDGMMALAHAPVHIHCGYNERQQTPLLTPFDSTVSGVYTVIYDDPTKLRAILRQLLEQRSYATCVNNPDEVHRITRQVADLLSGLKEAGVRFNPEVKRFETLNQKFFENCIQRIEEQVA